MSDMIKHFTDIGFTVVATPERHMVQFTGYAIFSTADPPADWVHEDELGCQVPVETLDAADVAFNGSVKWDGCTDWRIDDQDRGMLHSCSRHELLHYGEAMARCWDWARELLPHFDGGE